MPLTTVINNIHGDHILKNIGRTLNSATHSDQMLENNDKTKDSCYIIVILQLDILQEFFQLIHILTFNFMEDLE